MTGKVKFFDLERRFGFIIPEGVPLKERDRHVFFYQDVLPEGEDSLRAGQEVEYSLLPGYPSPRALMIRLLGRTSYAPLPMRRGA